MKYLITPALLLSVITALGSGDPNPLSYNLSFIQNYTESGIQLTSGTGSSLGLSYSWGVPFGSVVADVSTLTIDSDLTTTSRRVQADVLWQSPRDRWQSEFGVAQQWFDGDLADNTIIRGAVSRGLNPLTATLAFQYGETPFNVGRSTQASLALATRTERLRMATTMYAANYPEGQNSDFTNTTQSRGVRTDLRANLWADRRNALDLQFSMDAVNLATDQITTSASLTWRSASASGRRIYGMGGCLWD